MGFLSSAIIMSIAFIDRDPTDAEIERWRLIMSTFNDGSGQERDSEGNTRLGWRDIERVAAVMLGGVGGENKQIFDVVVKSPGDEGIHYGISVKSKELKRKGAIRDLDTGGRVYMELCNSPAKLWDPLKELGFTEADFSAMNHAEEIGPVVLETVEAWHTEYARLFSALFKECSLDLGKSIYLTVSYNGAKKVEDREYQIHSFPLEFPKDVIWKYNSDRCLRGYDPDFPEEVLFDWYGLSGGQLKYYPRADKAQYRSKIFKLEIPRRLSLEEKAGRYFPEMWVKASGAVNLDQSVLADELASYSKLVNDPHAKAILLEASKNLKKA